MTTTAFGKIELNAFGDKRHKFVTLDNFAFEVNERYYDDLDMVAQAMAEAARGVGHMTFIDDQASLPDLISLTV